MKKQWFYIFSFCVLMLAQACSSEKKEENKEEVKTAKADWSDKKKIILLASDYFLKGSLLNNPPSPHYLFTDPNDKLNYFYQASFTDNDSLFQESESVAFLKVNGLTPEKQPIVLDYKIIWKGEGEKAGFEVEEASLRSFKNTERYFWKKQGNFWERVITAKPI
ncbi:MAG: hypothetical protein EAZ97_10800 [Bacteroidetes bacterium]|nr:MAG: hypothetical protein EAZ97_10800 [Bacteroidota bacterium]